MNESDRIVQSSAQQTRAALIGSGLRLFGMNGFEATSIREIAASANANVASIAYHFGGKEGLRLACAEAIIAKLGEVVGSPILVCDPGEDDEKALQAIEAAIVAMIRFFTGRPEARDVAAFMMREMTHPSPAIDLIYSEMLFPCHNALCRLWGVATHRDPDSPATRLAVFAIIGQVLYFRLAQPIVCKRMEWKDIGPKEVNQIIAVIIGNMKTLISAAKDD